MAVIRKIDTLGVKPLLDKGELGLDMYTAGGDTGRVYIGTGTENIMLAKVDDLGATEIIATVGQTLISVINSASMILRIDNVTQTEGVDYTIVDGNTISMITPLVGGEVISAIDTSYITSAVIALGVEFAVNKDVANGYAGLDATGKVDTSILPSYVDDVLEYDTYADLPVTGESGKIYVVIADETSGDDTSSYRWTGSVYAMVSNTLTAADVKALYESNLNTNEYNDTEKAKVANIPADTIAELAGKQETLVNQVSIKSINGDSLLGAGTLLVSAGASGFAANVYLTGQVSSTVGTYSQLSYTPDAVTSEVSAVVTDAGEVLIEDYIFDGDVVADFIPAGEWQFHYYRRVDSGAQDTRVRFEVFARDSSGVERVLFSTYSDTIEDTVAARDNILTMQPSFVVDPTDRIGVKVYGSTTSNSAKTLTIEVGNGEASYLVTPLGLRHNQLRARDEEDSHPASAIRVVPQGNLSSTTVQLALVELQTNINGLTTIIEW